MNPAISNSEVAYLVNSSDPVAQRIGLRLAKQMMSLRARREALGWTQTALAKYSRVAVETINDIEHGRSRARYDTREKLLRVLGVPVDMHVAVFGPLPTYGRRAVSTQENATSPLCGQSSDRCNPSGENRG